MVDVRHARFNAGLIVSTLFNAHRRGESEALEVWDFIPGYERDAEEVESEKLTRSIRHSVEVAFTRMHGKTVEEVRETAKVMVNSLKANGTENADSLVREVFERVTKQLYGG